MGAQPAKRKVVTSTGPPASRKRKRPSAYAKTEGSESLTSGSKQAEPGPASQPKKLRNTRDVNEEKRLRKFRNHAPQSFTEVYARATSQRFYILSRTRCGSPSCLEEIVEMTGSTGNIYHVHIARQPTCDCPHAQAGNQCKHILYVMSRVLRARFDLVYQLSLLSSELEEIFMSAPPIEVGEDAEAPAEDKNRKEIEGDCPICFMPFEGEAIVYCRAQCGQNIHKECFEMWASTKNRHQVTCPMCRTAWQGDEDMVKKIQNTGIIGGEGYVNVADQLGIGRDRDTSTYYNGPRRGQRYYGPW